MTHHHGWLAIAEANGNYRELFNHARTAAYLSSSEVLGCRRVSNVLDDGGCEGYTWFPPGTDGQWDSSGEWFQQSYIDPIIDEAPWYNPNYPESGEALGFWITEWTGLDSGHIRREYTPLAVGGGQFGRTYSAAREMGFEVILLAESEAGMDYLFRWLDATLSSVCSTCSADTILIRRLCLNGAIDGTNASEGVVELRKVGLLSGLQWGDPPIENQGCYMRRLNFTLAAMDPCMYTPCTEVEVATNMNWAECFDVSNANPDRANCRPACSEMLGACRTTFDFSIDTPGASGIVLTLTVDGELSVTSETIPLRIRTYANPNGLEPDELCGAPLLGELYVSALPLWTEFRYDMTGRRVQYRNAGTGGFANGFGYLEPNDVGVPRFPALACGDYTVVVEPASFCYEYGVDPEPIIPSMELLIQERMGCA